MYNKITRQFAHRTPIPRKPHELAEFTRQAAQISGRPTTVRGLGFGSFLSFARPRQFGGLTLRPHLRLHRVHELEEVVRRRIQVNADGIHMQDVRKQDDHDHEDGQRVLLNPVVRGQVLLGAEEREDGRPVERRNGQQVEEHEVQVYENEIRQEQQVEIFEHDAAVHQLVYGERHVERPCDADAQKRLQQVGGGARETYDEVALARVLEVLRVVRHRLRVPENGQVHGHEHQRHEDRAERVDVPDGIERQPPRALRRRVAQLVRGEGMPHLVQHDGRDERQNGTDDIW